MEVDQGAAAIVMAESEADRRGIPKAHRVAYLGGGRSLDGWSVSVRRQLTASPGYAAAMREAQNHAEIDIDDVDLFDLYSCFPSAVQLAMQELGIAHDDPRGLTQTGGLAHHGGPGNAYSMHAVCNMVAALRAGRGSTGWVSGLGMTATKHAVCVLSTDPERISAADGRATEVELEPALREGPELVDSPTGPARVESYTVLFDRSNQPQRSIFLLRLPDGRRSMANGQHDAAEFRRLTESEGVGLEGHVTPGEQGAPNRFAIEA
jgi:acetyl-CoA C-acetyltransferase